VTTLLITASSELWTEPEPPLLKLVTFYRQGRATFRLEAVSVQTYIVKLKLSFVALDAREVVDGLEKRPLNNEGA